MHYYRIGRGRIRQGDDVLYVTTVHIEKRERN